MDASPRPYLVRPMRSGDIPSIVALQRACFPAPFPEALLWRAEHLARHLELAPEAQFVALAEGNVVASASNARLSEENWQRHAPWDETVGGPFLDRHDPEGTTLYGLDVSVHPDHRRRGLARQLYEARFDFVRKRRLRRYGTGCRLPGYAAWADSQKAPTPAAYGQAVASGEIEDRTLTPLLRLGLRLLEIKENYMEDAESGNAAALLEWTP